MLGKKLEHLLKMRDKSRKEMADILSISSRTVDKIFSGERELKTDEMIALGHFLQVNPNTFLDDSITNIFDNKDSSVSHFQGTNYHNQNDKIITAKDETIASVKETINALKEEIQIIKDSTNFYKERVYFLEKTQNNK